MSQHNLTRIDGRSSNNEEQQSQSQRLRQKLQPDLAAARSLLAGVAAVAVLQHHPSRRLTARRHLRRLRPPRSPLHQRLRVTSNLVHRARVPLQPRPKLLLLLLLVLLRLLPHLRLRKPRQHPQLDLRHPRTQHPHHRQIATSSMDEAVAASRHHTDSIRTRDISMSLLRLRRRRRLQLQRQRHRLQLPPHRRLQQVGPPVAQCAVKVAAPSMHLHRRHHSSSNSQDPRMLPLQRAPILLGAQ